MARRTSKLTYERLTTMNAWQAAAIEKALEAAIDRGTIDRRAGHATLEEFRRFSRPGSIIRFEDHA